MKNLQKFAKECMQELDSIGIEYGEVEKFEVNTRAKSRWGQCRHLPNGKHSINISSALLQDENSDRGLKQTIIHELLHTVKGTKGHKGKWANLAAKVNRELGYDVTRTNTAESLGVVKDNRKENIVYKYQFKCLGCGQIIRRQRVSNFTKHYDLYTCGRCHSGFERIY